MQSPYVENNNHFIYIGSVIAVKGDHTLKTVLGSCVSVCLWDPALKIGGMNHYMLPLWNGDGLVSPKYGNIAIERLVEKMVSLGSQVYSMKAKVFGGAAIFEKIESQQKIGETNIVVAEDMLAYYKIPVIASDVGGNYGRSLFFNTDSGSVLMKKLHREMMHTLEAHP